MVSLLLSALVERCVVSRMLGGGDKRAVTELGFAHVTTKSLAYLGMFGFFRNFFFCKKMPPPRPNHHFKIQWEIHFLSFLNTDRNAPKKKFRIEIWTFSFQICFKNQFSTSGRGQTENTRIRVYVYFPFDHFPKSKIGF